MRRSKILLHIAFAIFLLLIFSLKLSEVVIKLKDKETGNFNFYLSSALAVIAAIATFRVLSPLYKILINHIKKDSHR